MNRKLNVRSGGIAITVMVMAILTALSVKAAASSSETTASGGASQSYLTGYLAPQSVAPAIEIAQASQLQNDGSGYIPRPSSQGAPRQTLTLPQVAPQPSSGPAMELPPARGQEEGREVPQAPIERQPQTAVGRIPVTVTDNGRWVQDLRKQDLTVYEDGTRRPILGLQRDIDTPISIGIVVDTSGSMAWKLRAAEAALQHFVRTLNPRDQFFLIAFSDRAFLLQDFTDNPAGLNRAIALLHAYGNTALYDAVVQGLRKVEQGRWPKKALLVMTDGMDNQSSNSLNDAIEAGRRAGVLIYTVGLGTSAGGPMIHLGGIGIGFGFGGGFGPMGTPMGGGEADLVDASTLRRLSDETGATTFVMNPRVTDMSRLDAHFQDISAELRAQYTVRYASAGGSRPHQIRVEGLRPGMEVRAPKWTGAGASEYGG
ncbi:MAG TPA: VWA domain-containing protein [Candidatus Binataceae bacterium]